jgi:hypothetical protein
MGFGKRDEHQRLKETHRGAGVGKVGPAGVTPVVAIPVPISIPIVAIPIVAIPIVAISMAVIPMVGHRVQVIGGVGGGLHRRYLLGSPRHEPLQPDVQQLGGGMVIGYAGGRWRWGGCGGMRWGGRCSICSILSIDIVYSAYPAYLFRVSFVYRISLTFLARSTSLPVPEIIMYFHTVPYSLLSESEMLIFAPDLRVSWVM